MLIVKVDKGGIERAIKKLRSKVRNVKQLRILRENKQFVKPSEKKRLKYLKKINKTKKIYLLAKTEDKNGKEFIEIIKHKNYPFYGFQGHVERSNPELLIPYVIDIKRSFNKRCIKLNKSCKLKKIVYGKTVKCKDYGLAKKNNNRKCFIYNI